MPFNILLVEDVASDALLTRIAIKKTQVPHTLHTLQKGNEVMPYMYQSQKRVDSSLLDVIMFDLGLPCVDGFEVLEELAGASASIRGVPIIILTGH